MGQDLPQTPLSLYLHIPFCLTRCGYCSFFSVPYRRDALENYLNILQKELELYSGLLSHPLQSVYFGGGSPSLLSPLQINSITSRLRLCPDAEITLEINPVQITPAYLKGLQSTPVNRLSIGVQSMADSELQWLGRKHRASSIKDKLSLCRDSGYRNISLDLIYGLPEAIAKGLDSLRHNLNLFLELNPDHISCYMLSLDEDSPLGRQSAQHAFPLPGDTLAAREYHLIRQTLIREGFHHYEISNFARRGYESRHNLCYWQGNNYLGCGASAAGWIQPLRYQNPASLEAYGTNVAQGILHPDAQRCDATQIVKDKLMMGLRMVDGIDLGSLNWDGTGSLKPEIIRRSEKLKKIGMLKQRGQVLALSTRALFVSNAVIGELLY